MLRFFKMLFFLSFLLLGDLQFGFAQAQEKLQFNSRIQKAHAMRDSLLQKHQHMRLIARGDSLNIRSQGEGNSIQLDSLKFQGDVNKTLKGQFTKGNIEQEGSENVVDIHSQGTGSVPQQVEIKQTGNNNKVTVQSGTINPKSNNHKKNM